ncbi:MAG: hypothetical protein OTI35_09635 [Sulfitobacter sp.]|nr:hypothetical protein [Sulfitobacter sp.]
MISSIHNQLYITPISVAFKRMITHIKIAQKAEEAAQNLAEITSKKETTLTEVADQIWTQAYQLSREISASDAETERDFHYIDVAQLLFGLLSAHPDGWEDFADRAAEKRAELGTAHRSVSPDLVDGLKFLVWPTGLPNTNLGPLSDTFGP